jgi:predicted ATP-dependent serine protease
VIPGLIPKKGRSLYLDWESDDWDIDDRVKKVAAGAGITTKPQIGYRECIGPLNDQIEDIVREVEKAGVTFIVIDSVGMALSASAARAATRTSRRSGCSRRSGRSSPRASRSS